MKYLATFSLLMMMFVGALTAQDKSAAELKNEGNAALKAKDYKTALGLFEKAIAAWGDEETDAAMIFNTATCARKEKKYDTAIKYYDRSISEAYKADAATYFKAKCLEKVNKEDEAEKVLTAGIEAYAGEKYADQMKKDLAKIYVRKSNDFFTEGTNLLNTRVDGNRDQWDEIKAKAKVELDKAAELANKALELNPADENAQKILDSIKASLEA